MLTENRDETRERIIDAALNRFTYYGASKTTMNEIAEDLHCSKASLYYYFPDKQALHVAVLEKAGETYFHDLQEKADQAVTARQAFMELIATRHEFARRFCRLELFKVLKDKHLVRIANKAFEAARDREIGIITNIIEKGVDRGEMVSADPAKVAALYMHAMIGLRLSLVSKDLSEEISDEEFERVREWQVQLADIFINSLKK
ncbi:TetR/AcrR family transcriptional regulator [Chitinophaga rhizosphaerae]|uniref:TetR/AcrR family transcriptional regulator n=1 Tax=Chitinophaga rhizosphaerae TaxID=1864947 RepID=UPI000F804046|nr:TetR/AcrR family transcriptional regulator [Chitinophaga rhizosphaerae]